MSVIILMVCMSYLMTVSILPLESVAPHAYDRGDIIYRNATDTSFACRPSTPNTRSFLGRVAPSDAKSYAERTQLTAKRKSIPVLREMERSLPLPRSHIKLLLHNIERTVVRHLQVVHASHHAWQVVIRSVWWLAWLADDREQWRQCFETWKSC